MQEVLTKVCFKCGCIKPYTDFYKHTKMADGYLGKCKECTKADAQKNYRGNIDYYKTYDKGRSKLPHRVKAAKVYVATPKGRLVAGAAKKKWIDCNPLKRAAHKIYRKWKKNNLRVLPSACENCDKEGTRLNAHHDDYSKPLLVRYLCGKCHRAWHDFNGEGLNG